MHLAYKYKVHCLKYQLPLTSYTSSYLQVPSIIVALTIETEFS